MVYLPVTLPTLITPLNQLRRFFHHLLDHFADRLEIFFLRFPEFVHVEVIPRKGVLLR